MLYQAQEVFSKDNEKFQKNCFATSSLASYICMSEAAIILGIDAFLGKNDYFYA